ncbi:MAG: hypothetical protein JOZ24_05270 [Candidatus Eremiobacteraeota bacterium]|nr:hypothetical protein [Candidatus Eremiobacteraeota bacterium]
MNLLHSLRSSVARTVVAALLAIALGAAALAPAQALLDKSRFALHLGIAYFAFHRWVLKPYKTHAFDNGAPHRTATIVKGGVALLFAVHEVRVASKIAHLSKDPLLQKIAGGVDQLGASFGTVGQRLKGGQFSPDDVSALDGATTSLGSAAAGAGAPIKDRPVAIPGL